MKPNDNRNSLIEDVEGLTIIGKYSRIMNDKKLLMLGLVSNSNLNPLLHPILGENFFRKSQIPYVLHTKIDGCTNIQNFYSILNEEYRKVSNNR